MNICVHGYELDRANKRIQDYSSVNGFARSIVCTRDKTDFCTEIQLKLHVRTHRYNEEETGRHHVLHTYYLCIRG